jgi:hypothetical protein
MNFLEYIKIKIINFFANIIIVPSPLYIMFKSHPYAVNGPMMRDILGELKPGDILLRKYKYYITNWFIPGYFSHAAIYVGDNSIIHMLGNGIVKEDILTFMRCDDICILRYPKISNFKLAKVLNNVQALYDSKVGYDYSFNSKNEKYYCTELIDIIFEDDIQYTNRISSAFISPDDLVTSNLEKIYPINKN